MNNRMTPYALCVADAALDPVQHWQQAMLQGNAIFECGEPARALVVYQQGLDQLLIHFSAWPQAEDALEALFVSHLNVSEAQRCCGWVDAAAATLSSHHQNLLQIIEREALPLRFRDAARVLQRRSYAALQRFQTLCGDHPQIQRWLRGACICAACAERLAVAGAGPFAGAFAGPFAAAGAAFKPTVH
jgi:hypothetical protein